MDPVLDQFESRATHKMVECGFGQIIGESAFESHLSMTGGAHHHAPFATSGYHLTGRGLNDLKIGQDVNVQRPLNQRAIGLKKILLFFLVGSVAHKKIEWT